VHRKRFHELSIHLPITAVTHGLTGTVTRAFSRFGDAQSAGNDDVEREVSIIYQWGKPYENGFGASIARLHREQMKWMVIRFVNKMCMC